jgi:hypothetical protein
MSLAEYYEVFNRLMDPHAYMGKGQGMDIKEEKKESGSSIRRGDLRFSHSS